MKTILTEIGFWLTVVATFALGGLGCVFICAVIIAIPVGIIGGIAWVILALLKGFGVI